MTAAVLVLCGALGADVVINELHYAPAEKTIPEEFIEIFNAGEEHVDLSGWSFDCGVAFVFPPGTVLAGKRYLVLAQDPALLRAKHTDITVVGPYQGRLANSGERLRLVDGSGRVVDELRYGNSFPWPIVDRRYPASIELVHATLDNALGGSWRRARSDGKTATVFIDEGASWRYRKGSAEPSEPMYAWRRVDYDDRTWTVGRAPIGFGEKHLNTTLSDMRGRYSSLYLRHDFEVGDVVPAADLILEVSYDDGFVAWINGVLVASSNVVTTEPKHGAVATSLPASCSGAM